VIGRDPQQEHVAVLAPGDLDLLPEAVADHLARLAQQTRILVDLPLDLLKIDRSFIANLPRGNADRAVTAAIVGLASDLGMTTVAEGVETVDQLRCVIDLGCDQAQGYLFASPMPIASVSGWLERWRQRERRHLLEWSGNAPRLRLAKA
jgi:EAL domain-containing protein (putative c-di-GMP-specific phosphodiesterase class I)